MQVDVVYPPLMVLARRAQGIQSRSATLPTIVLRTQRGMKLVASAFFLAAGLWLIVTLGWQEHVVPASYRPAPRATEQLAKAAEALSPQAIVPMSMHEALIANLAIPLGSNPLNAAKPFYGLGDGVRSSRALDCLTTAIHYEAASESNDGKRAVAQVVLNRVRHPAFPATVCGVVFQGAERPTGCQFSFTCDGSMHRKPLPSAWLAARMIAMEALSGHVFAPAGLATHYHADYVLPYWAHTLTKNIVVGRHIFYQWRGRWGEPRAFGQRYAGTEPQILVTNGFESNPVLTDASPLPVLEERSVIDLDGSPIDSALQTSSTPAARYPKSGAPTARYVIALDPPSSIKMSMAGP